MMLYKTLIMELLNDPTVRIVDYQDTIVFERHSDSLIFNVKENTCQYMIGNVCRYTVVVHRYMVLVAMKRVIEECLD
jgi:hypothetical protein